MDAKCCLNWVLCVSAGRQNVQLSVEHHQPPGRKTVHTRILPNPGYLPGKQSLDPGTEGCGSSVPKPSVSSQSCPRPASQLPRPMSIPTRSLIGKQHPEATLTQHKDGFSRLSFSPFLLTLCSSSLAPSSAPSPLSLPPSTDHLN